MSQRYYMQLSYDGTDYHGWQIQPNGTTVQDDLQKALSTILREDIAIVGCGRTDTGVHAKYFVAHFDYSSVIADVDKMIYKLNGFLSKDISILDLQPVDDAFHARFTATARAYEYHLVTQKSSFLNRYSYRPNFELDFDAMNRAARCLLDFTDFTSFSKLHTDTHTNNCDVSVAFWEKKNDHHWVFHVTADRFLRNMVRAIVGTLLEVGKGKISEAQFSQIIEAKDRGKAGISVPAQALFLVDVVYPEVYIKR